MRLALFGATGRTGRLVLEQALAQGYSVTALARDPAKVTQRHERLRLVQGDVRDPEKVAETVAGACVVVSVLGPSSNKPELAVSQGLENVIAAMKQHGVRRLIQTSGAGVRDPLDRLTPLHAFFGGLVKLLTPNVLADMTATVAKVRASGLDWTVVRAPMLTDQAATGHVRVGYVGTDIGPRISRADLAAFVVRQVEERAYVGKAPAVSG